MSELRNPSAVLNAAQKTTILTDLPQVPAPVVKKYETTELNMPKQTSPTLLEFPGKWTKEPEWKRDLREKVRSAQEKRTDRQTESPTVSFPADTKTPELSAPRLLIEISSENETNQNPILAKALKRIEASRRLYARDLEYQMFLEESAATEKPALEVAEKPRLVAVANHKMSTVFDAGEPRSTSDVPRLTAVNSFAPPRNLMNPVALRPVVMPKETDFAFKSPVVTETYEPATALPFEGKTETTEIKEEISRDLTAEIPLIKSGILPKTIKFDEKKCDSYLESLISPEEGHEDFAPFPQRLLAGLVDVGLSILTAALIAAPFGFLTHGLSALNISILLGVSALVLFAYITLMIKVFGTTLGAMIFSLYVIDAETGEMPTLKQSAISSAVYLASLFFLGAGFLTILLSPEKRALHDLLSGTMVIRETE